MLNRARATIATELYGDLQPFFDRGTFRSPNDFTIVRYLREVDRLPAAQQIDAWCLRSYIAQICGDLDLALAHAERAEVLPDGQKFGLFAKACAYSNLGYFSSSAPLARDLVHPNLGEFSGYFPLLISSGLFATASSYFEDLPRMGIEQPRDFSKTYGEAAEMLARAGVSENEVTRLLDVAGLVMRNRGLMAAGEQPEVSVHPLGGQRIVHVVYMLNVSAKETAAANWELAGLMAERDDPAIDCVHVSFEVAA